MDCSVSASGLLGVVAMMMGRNGAGRWGAGRMAEPLAYPEREASEEMAEVMVATLGSEERMVAMVEAPGAREMLAVTGGQLEWGIPWGFREATDRG